MAAVLGAFFDDSGTHASAPVIVMGGMVRIKFSPRLYMV